METLEMEAPAKKKAPVPLPENKRLKQVRLKLGFEDRTEFSTKVGIERSAYIKMETGPSRPSTESLLKIKAVFRRFNLNFIADETAPILLDEPAAQLPPILPPSIREGFPQEPGAATPMQADFVGKYIARLENENTKKDELITWLQTQLEVALGKPLSSAYAAIPEAPRTEISMRPEACRAEAEAEAKVVSMWTADELVLMSAEVSEVDAA